MPEATLPAWSAAVDFMRQAKQSGQVVMSIPEDTSLYFFAGVSSPTRVFAFTPGILSPGPMTVKTIAEMEVVPVRYVIWSNRRFPEYGVPEFGVDYDVPFAEYIRSHYRPCTGIQLRRSAGCLASDPVGEKAGTVSFVVYESWIHGDEWMK